jgi:hypothetical protein
MGSDLYAAVDISRPNDKGYFEFIEKTWTLARGLTVTAFGCTRGIYDYSDGLSGYLDSKSIREMGENPESPWHSLGAPLHVQHLAPFGARGPLRGYDRRR